MIKDYLHLARPHQYTKNLFIFVPAFFAFQLNSLGVWINGLQAFVAYCLIASSVYTLNDWMDRKEDRKHPDKKDRPIAAGRIGKTSAYIFMTLLLIAGLLTSYTVSLEVIGLLGFYYILNVAYTIKLKHVPLLDISIIATGFVIRLIVGSVATNIVLSHWIIVITFLLALFLALAKRRDDVLIFLKTDKKTRKVIDGYNLKFLDIALAMTATIVIIAYILWAISPEVSERLHSDKLYLSAIFVLLGILRYLQQAIVLENGGNPSVTLLKDRFIQSTLFCWVLSFVWLLYL
ncbi:MAG: decaprenyl-phosphate phosphoribosyltransferase [Bacteroidota bacterium]